MKEKPGKPPPEESKKAYQAAASGKAANEKAPAKPLRRLGEGPAHRRERAPVNVGPGRSAILRPENVACVGSCDGCINDLGVACTCWQARDGEPGKDRACHILAPAIAAVLAPVDPAFLRPDIDHVRIGLRDLYRRDRASIQNGRNIP